MPLIVVCESWCGSGSRAPARDAPIGVNFSTAVIPSLLSGQALSAAKGLSVLSLVTLSAAKGLLSMGIEMLRYAQHDRVAPPVVTLSAAEGLSAALDCHPER